MSSSDSRILYALAGTTLVSTSILLYQTYQHYFCISETERIIAKRRTIQPDTYDPTRPVSLSSVERMLESAHWAPTHGKTEPWRFIVFSGQNALKELGDKDASLYKTLTTKKEFKEKRYLKKMRCKLQSSFVIAIGMVRQKSEKIPFDDEEMAVACAVQNMVINIFFS